MNLDRLCISFIFLHLPLLILPKQYLFSGLIFGGIIILTALWKRRFLLFLLGVFLSFAYFSVGKTVKNAEHTTAHKQKVEFKIQKILKQTDYQTAIARLNTGEKVYLNWQAEQPLQLHRYYQAELNLRPIFARQNIGNFDRKKWYFANHINMVSTVRKAELLEKNTDNSFRTGLLNKVKRKTENLPTQGLLLTLAFGERAWLKTEQWKIFQHTATAHLIAISGLHIALAMVFGLYLGKSVQWLCLKSEIKLLQKVGFSLYFTRILGFCIALGYSYLAGFAIPTVRALLAIAFVLLCQFFRKHYTAWQFWYRIVALLILLDPLTLLSDSFWLSILAVAGLILWYQIYPLNHFIKNGERIGSFKIGYFFLSLLHLQIGIWLIFLPVQLYFFEGISLFSLVANLLIVPLYSFLLVPIILFSLLTDKLFSSWELADYLAQLSLKLLERFSFFWFSLSYWQQWQLISVNLLILLLIYCKNRLLAPKKWGLAIAFSVLFNISFYLPKLLPQPKSEWLTFDVEQGLAMALIYERNKAVFYDTASSWKQADGSFNSMLKLEILPYLKRNGIEVEAIFLSHDDNDHSGGVIDLLTEYPKAKLISSSKISYQNKESESCIQGKQWQFGEWQLLAIYPTEVTERANNQDSCVILAKNNRYKILLTGDSGVKQERIFRQNLDEIDFLQVGHHGSKSSTGETLLAITQPKFAIISAGKWNPWKLPNKQVIDRLMRHNIETLNTAESGMIRVKFYQNKIEIEQARDRYSAWYRQK